jgi:hypothetical protein
VAVATHGSRAVIPLFFCIAHSAEIFLKSYLSANARQQSAGKDHDLKTLLAALLALGLIVGD